MLLRPSGIIILGKSTPDVPQASSSTDNASLAHDAFWKSVKESGASSDEINTAFLMLATGIACGQGKWPEDKQDRWIYWLCSGIENGLKNLGLRKSAREIRKVSGDDLSP